MMRTNRYIITPAICWASQRVCCRVSGKGARTNHSELAVVVTQEHTEGNLFDVRVRMDTITCRAPQTIGVLRSEGTCDGHRSKCLHYIVAI
jgi:hypothetical protein